jgi:dTMP kinase
MFICIEGIDASGKATQSKLLAQHLGAELFSFPDYEQPMGRLILGHLKGYWGAEPDGMDGACKLGVVTTADGRTISLADTKMLNAYVFQALQLANRMEKVAKIKEALAQKRPVVADRYWPSGVVYGSADGLDPEWLERIQAPLPQPDLYLLLDVDVAESSQRRPERRDRYEGNLEFLEKVHAIYRQLWANRQLREGNRQWVVVNGRLSVEEVGIQIQKAVTHSR